MVLFRRRIDMFHYPYGCDCESILCYIITLYPFGRQTASLHRTYSKRSQWLFPHVIFRSNNGLYDTQFIEDISHSSSLWLLCYIIVYRYNIICFTCATHPNITNCMYRHIVLWFLTHDTWGQRVLLKIKSNPRAPLLDINCAIVSIIIFGQRPNLEHTHQRENHFNHFMGSECNSGLYIGSSITQSSSKLISIIITTLIAMKFCV